MSSGDEEGAVWRWSSPGTSAGTVVWSPLSNLWLYGSTTAVPDTQAAGIGVALGTDWGPSGTKNQLGEIKVARLWADRQGWDLTDADLVAMITTTRGDALARAWKVPVGRLVGGGLGDVVVLARRHRDVWRNVVTAREADVALVVEGQPRLGSAALMGAAGARRTTAVPVGSTTKRATLVRPDDASRAWSWRDVVARLNAVRAAAATQPPRGPAGGRGRVPMAAPLAGDPEGTPTMAVRLDMPGGRGCRRDRRPGAAQSPSAAMAAPGCSPALHTGGS